MQWPSMLSSSSSQQGVRKNQFISGHTPRFLPLFACRCYNSGSGSIPISCWNKRSDARPLGQHPDITLAIRPTNTNKQPQNKFASAAGLDGSLRKFTSGPPGHFANEQPDIERWKLSRTPGHWQTTSLQSDQFGSQPSQFICSVNRRAKVHFISLMKLFFLRSITPVLGSRPQSHRRWPLLHKHKLFHSSVFLHTCWWLQLSFWCWSAYSVFQNVCQLYYFVILGQEANMTLFGVLKCWIIEVTTVSKWSGARLL